MGQKLRVGLVYGGKSGEHDVSLQTAIAVMKALDFSRYELVPFYITQQGEWRRGTQLAAPLESTEMLKLEAETEQGNTNALNPLFGRGHHPVSSSGKKSASEETDRIDVIFPLLHGTFGEDGTIQGLLEMANIPYVGAGVLASAVGMDKIMMKKIFAGEGLPQCGFCYFNKKQWERDQAYFVMDTEVTLGYPCFIKPANLGSSVGISKASNRDELIAAVDEALRYDRKVIIEEAVDGREIEVAILGNEEPKVSVPGEIVSSNEFYDYKAKYMDGKSAMIIPADVDEQTTKRLQEMAEQAFLAIDGSGLSRVDFFLRHSDGALLINEINTMPGFTPFSMYPLLWKESGIEYKELLDHLLELAVKRYNDKQNIQYGFEV